MKDLDIVFSRWKQWNERTALEGIKYPGVYILARFKDRVPRIVRPRAERIIYIGETCDNTLRGRLRQFNRSAFENKRGHSGGHTYRELFGDRGRILHVAIFPVSKLDGELRPLFIRYVERKLIWDYSKRWGAAPICNKK